MGVEGAVCFALDMKFCLVSVCCDGKPLKTQRRYLDARSTTYSVTFYRSLASSLICKMQLNDVIL